MNKTKDIYYIKMKRMVNYMMKIDPYDSGRWSFDGKHWSNEEQGLKGTSKQIWEHFYPNKKGVKNEKDKKVSSSNKALHN